MMKKLHLNIVSPEKELFNGAVCIIRNMTIRRKPF